jgi:hypothetical protein
VTNEQFKTHTKAIKRERKQNSKTSEKKIDIRKQGNIFGASALGDSSYFSAQILQLNTSCCISHANCQLVAAISYVVDSVI